jgi:hypothetical protein
MHDFDQFNSADVLLLYPPFSSTLRINNTAYTYKYALAAWRRRHCPGHRQCAARVVENGTTRPAKGNNHPADSCH